MGQHNSFKKDIDMLSEAYGQMYSDKKVVEEGRLGAALGAGGDKKSDEETHDKTGQMSDHDLLDAVEKKHTAGRALLDKAREELEQNGSLSAHTRDSLARDEYGYHGEDEEDTDEADQKRFKKYDKRVDAEAEAEGFDPDAD